MKPEAPDVLLKHQILTLILNTIHNSTVKNAFRDSFPLHQALVLLIQKHGIEDQSEMTYNCLQLLEIITDEMKVESVDHHMKNLIHLLVSEVNNSNHDIALSCLHILSNLCWINPAVQVEVKQTVPNLKRFCRALFNKLSGSSKLTCIYAFSVLTSLLNDDAGLMILGADRILQAFELVVHMIDSRDPSAVIAAGNLLNQFMCSEHMLAHILRHDSFPHAVRRIATLLVSSENPEITCTALKILLTVANMPNACSSLLEIVFSDNQMAENEKLLQFLCELVISNAKSDSTVNGLQLLSRLVKELLKICKFDYTEVVYQALPSVVDAVKNHILHPLQNVEKKLENLKNVLQLLVELFSIEHARNEGENILDGDFVEKIAEACFEEYSFNHRTRDLQADVIIELLLLLDVLRTHDFENTQLQKKLFTEPFVLSLLARTLFSSSDKEKIRQVLYLYNLCNSILPSSTNILCGMISSNNENLKGSKCMKDETAHLNQHPNPISAGRVDNLMEIVEQIEIKDVKMSEIMQLYNCKISLLQAKLKDFEEVNQKLCDYQCIQAQMETEANKLREMLVYLQQKTETLSNNLKQEQERVKEEQDKCRDLQQIIDEQKDAILDQSKRYETPTKKFNKLDQECSAQTEKILMHGRLLLQITELEDEKKNLTKLVKEKDLKMKEIIRALEEKEEMNIDLNQQVEKLEQIKSENKALLESNANMTVELDQLRNLRQMICQLTISGANAGNVSTQ